MPVSRPITLPRKFAFTVRLNAVTTMYESQRDSQRFAANSPLGRRPSQPILETFWALHPARGKSIKRSC